MTTTTGGTETSSSGFSSSRTLTSARVASRSTEKPYLCASCDARVHFERRVGGAHQAHAEQVFDELSGGFTHFGREVGDGDAAFARDGDGHVGGSERRFLARFNGAVEQAASTAVVALIFAAPRVALVAPTHCELRSVRVLRLGRAGSSGSRSRRTRATRGASRTRPTAAPTGTRAEVAAALGPIALIAASTLIAALTLRAVALIAATLSLTGRAIALIAAALSLPLRGRGGRRRVLRGAGALRGRAIVGGTATAVTTLRWRGRAVVLASIVSPVRLTVGVSASTWRRRARIAATAVVGARAAIVAVAVLGGRARRALTLAVAIRGRAPSRFGPGRAERWSPLRLQQLLPLRSRRSALRRGCACWR